MIPHRSMEVDSFLKCYESKESGGEYAQMDKLVQSDNTYCKLLVFINRNLIVNINLLCGLIWSETLMMLCDIVLVITRSNYGQNVSISGLAGAVSLAGSGGDYEYNVNDLTCKLFSRQSLTDTLLDQIFSIRNETLRINWGAYPHYHAPEEFAPIMLDDMHLYHVNAFENASSTMETSDVAAENMARLILSRLAGQQPLGSYGLKSSTSDSNFKPSASRVVRI
ncbi:hypothetical protein L1987_00829 [Smallanthus sonchifolius]|uniref:Uncharacterized protein n=1 Tax=Smallanthus sonchifolius TaxID=185202 RepID=A0ACB9K3L5_9ASTR|nr:hypothetical protein L1987_00829 [Smallanthus sonchifolius]